MNSSLPPIFFNHLYIVLDDKTYRAIQASDFLCIAFPGMERRSTRTAAGEAWSGTYFYCQDNYLELFGESTGRHWTPRAAEGWAGLAFSADRLGGAAAVQRRIEEEFGYAPYHELRQLETASKTVNWFHYVRLAETLGLESFDAWVMEYHPDIFAHKGLDIPASGELTREAYLAPWNADPRSPQACGSRREGPVFSRVTGATLTMGPGAAGRFSQVLQALGFAQAQETGQVTLSANGFAVTIRIHSEDGAPPGYRLSSLRLAMARPSVAPTTFVFAPGSRLILNSDLTAEWLFGE
jgi:hypothetical protein